MTARRVQVRITRERTGLGDLVAEVACPGCGTRAEFIGYPSAIEIADGRVRCCRPLQDDLVRDPAASPRGLAAQLGRTVAAVRERRRLLGLPAAWPARHCGSPPPDPSVPPGRAPVGPPDAPGDAPRIAGRGSVVPATAAAAAADAGSMGAADGSR